MAVSPASAYADTRAPSARVGTSAHSSHDALVDGLDATLRDLVRREGVDPQRDADVVRRLAEGVVRRHDDHSLTGAVAPLADPDAVVGELLARVSGFGPLQPLLDDPSVEDVCAASPPTARDEADLLDLQAGAVLSRQASCLRNAEGPPDRGGQPGRGA